MGKIIPGNRSNPHPGASDAPALIVQGEGVGQPKRIQRDFALHPISTTSHKRRAAHIPCRASIQWPRCGPTTIEVSRRRGRK